MEEFNDLKIECMYIEDDQKRKEILEKIDNLNKEIAKECEEAIKHLAGLIRDCSSAYERLSITTGEGELKELLELIIERLRELDPKNALFHKN